MPDTTPDEPGKQPAPKLPLLLGALIGAAVGAVLAFGQLDSRAIELGDKSSIYQGVGKVIGCALVGIVIGAIVRERKS
jgi:hypothetical protein